jgi:ribosomal protein S18 acetylase RimI-like enzyme
MSEQAPSIRPTGEGDEEFLWLMLFYASHSNDEPGVSPEDIRSNPDLIGYIDGWRAAGYPGVLAGDLDGAAWLRLFGDTEQTDPVFVDPKTPELAIAVRPGMEGRGIGTAMIEVLLFTMRGRYPAIVLSSRMENRAVGLYERLGFRVVGHFDNRVGTRSVKMIAEL